MKLSWRPNSYYGYSFVHGFVVEAFNHDLGEVGDGGCLVGVWWVFGGCLVGVLWVLGECLVVV